MQCPACNSRSTGRVGADQFYCWDCCVEFSVDPSGATQIYEVGEEGDLVNLAEEEEGMQG